MLTHSRRPAHQVQENTKLAMSLHSKTKDSYRLGIELSGVATRNYREEMDLKIEENRLFDSEVNFSLSLPHPPNAPQYFDTRFRTPSPPQQVLESKVSFGGAHAVQAIEQELEEAEETLAPQLDEALVQLERAQASRAKVKDQLAGIIHDRDLLLTRIEVLEQAVRMMHGQIEMKTHMDDQAAEESETNVGVLESRIGTFRAPPSCLQFVFQFVCVCVFFFYFFILKHNP